MILNKENIIFTVSAPGNGGRLGNCLFTFSALVGIAKQHGGKFVFPHWEHSKHFKNWPKEIINPATITHVYREPNFHYTPFDFEQCHQLRTEQQTVIDIQGYFQSQKYWASHKEKVLNLFEFNDEITNEVEGLKNTFGLSYKERYGNEDYSLIALHLRYGDYVNNTYYADLHRDGYYKRAIEFLADRCNAYNISPVFMIFTDDVEKATEKMREYQAEFTDAKFGVLHTTEILDLCFMSCCAGIICANSSYSWWAAMLNKSQNKKVVMPKNWFDNEGLKNDTRDLYPEFSIIM